MSEARVLAGRYELGPMLGSGGMASVFRATDRVLERTVAVKLLHPRIAEDPSYVARFRREARLAATLSHPGVVSVFDTGQDEGVWFIVMEHVPGRTLAEEIAREGPFGPERAASVAAAVCDALASAHARGLVHRDVKPANIMLTADGRPKVMDFGIARAESSDTLTQTATVMGTAAYLSPEQARGERADARSDLYALGCVLYAMLTGDPPFSGHSAVAVATRHLSDQPAAPSRVRSGIPLELDEIVLRALEKDPADRYRDAPAMRAALRRAAGEATPTDPKAADGADGATQPVAVPAGRPEALPPTDPLPAAPAEPPRGPRHASPPTGLRRALGAGGIVLALLALVALGYALTSRGGGGGGTADRPRDRVTAEATDRTPTPEPTPSPEPTESPPPDVTDSEPETAFAGLIEALEAGLASGQISEGTAEKIGERAGRALDHFAEGKQDDALRELEKAAGDLTKAAEKGEVTEAAAALVRDSLERLIAAISGP